jgi:hypothetical protein
MICVTSVSMRAQQFAGKVITDKDSAIARVAFAQGRATWSTDVTIDEAAVCIDRILTFRMKHPNAKSVVR